MRWQMAYHLGVGMVLVDRDELGPEAQADDGDMDSSRDLLTNLPPVKLGASAPLLDARSSIDH